MYDPTGDHSTDQPARRSATILSAAACMDVLDVAYNRRPSTAPTE
jgi:hypothetical protein